MDAAPDVVAQTSVTILETVVAEGILRSAPKGTSNRGVVKKGRGKGNVLNEKQTQKAFDNLTREFENPGAPSPHINFADDLNVNAFSKKGGIMDLNGHKAKGGGFFERKNGIDTEICLLYTSPSPRDATLSRMPSSA